MRSAWLEQIDTDLPEIIKIASKCETQYQLKCFELLLAFSLNTMSKGVSGAELKKITSSNDTKQIATNLPNNGNSAKFDRFLTENGLNRSDIENVIELDTGEIIGTNLGSNGAEIARNIAVLLAIEHLYTEGIFQFTTDEVKDRTSAYGVLFHNQKRDLKKVNYESKKVFIETNDTWKIPIPAQGYVVKVIKNLCKVVE